MLVNVKVTPNTIPFLIVPRLADLDPRDLILRGKEALLSLPSGERAFHMLWLTVPLVLLIERTPGDVWLTFLTLAFIGRSFLKRDWGWLREVWVVAGLFFWLVCILSALLSDNWVYSLGESIIWIRFPLFAAASAFWLGKNSDILNLMLLIVAATMAAMCIILAAELFFKGYGSGVRLTWPYNDKVPGSHIAKVSGPVVYLAIALALSSQGIKRAWPFLFATTVVCFVILTGERVMALLLISGSALTFFTITKSIKSLTIFVFFAAAIIAMLISIYPQLGGRYLTDFVGHLPIHSDSPYYKTWLTGLAAFETSHFFGIGPGNIRDMCTEIVPNLIEYNCHNHPHNFYFQLLGETGAIGLFGGVTFLSSVVFSCLKAHLHQDVLNLKYSVAWIVPFSLFFPFSTHPDFFGQWQNIFMWFGVALAISMSTTPNSQKM